ncbi:MAG: lipocalin-like domain-containing protein [Burkholderiales bacterium]|nr:MAG: lipocalin-like domain-containing protein [Burkholderiales bacterium]
MRQQISTVAAAFFLCFAQTSSAQDLASQIIGAWKWTGHVYKEVATGKTTNVFGEKPSGLQVFTKGGNAVFAVFHDSRKAPAANPATEAERAALFATMAAAISTYKVEGNTLTMTYSGSWNQSWTGTTQKRQIEIVGNKLTLMSAPFKSAQTGQDTVFVVTYERAD